MADQIFSVSGVSATVNPSTWGKGSAWGEGSFNAGGSVLFGDSGYVGNADGWGRYAWGRADWGDTNLITEGWGRLAWGDQGWGNSPGATLTGLGMTMSIGPEGWGYNAWGHGAWESYTIDYAISELPTGVSATASLGTVTETRSSTQTPTGVSSTASLGSLSINNGADHVQGLGGQAVTASVGSLGFTWICFPDGVEATTSVGDLTITSIELIDVTGVSATVSVGSITPAAMSIGLTGLSSTASVGSISPTEMQMGLTGVSATASVADLTTSSGGGIFGYADIDTGSNVTYIDVTAP